MKKIQVPKDIYHIQGSKPGPVVCVLGGTHGDEVVGVEVVKKMITDLGLTNKEPGKTYESNTLSGELFIGFGNPIAIEKGTRAAEDGPDLNRSFLKEEIEAEPKEDDRYDLVRARELFPIFEQTDLLIDLHSTHAHSVPFVCLGNTSRLHEEMYAHVPVEHVLIDPDNVLPKDVGRDQLPTTDQAVNLYGGSNWSVEKYGKKTGVAFAYESGSKEDTGKIDKVYEVVNHILGHIGLFGERVLQEEESTPMSKKKVYTLAAILKAKRGDGFEFKDGMKKGWVEVKKGDVLGSYTATGENEVAPFDGVVIFQKDSSSLKEGESICYLATIV